MRLISVVDFVEHDDRFVMIEAYDEVQFEDVQYILKAQKKRRTVIDDFETLEMRTKPGYSKLAGALRTAHYHGWPYLWIDTCCIDSKSSAELSEAINSMHSYYSSAKICYAYLEDVHSEDGSGITASRYWTRGWTLQEVLCPSEVIFFNTVWTEIGTRSAKSELISIRTGIDVLYLTHPVTVYNASIAERMFWASQRSCLREEDVAYCLLGLMQVNMPLLYGEGKQKAFQRLQEELMRRYTDHSLFAWKKPGILPLSHRHGLLADGPEDFATSGSIRAYSAPTELTLPVMTARGLHLELPMISAASSTMRSVVNESEGHVYFAILNCPSPAHNQDTYLALMLEQIEHTNTFVRIQCSGVFSSQETGQATSIYVVQDLAQLPFQTVYPHHHLQIGSLGWNDADMDNFEAVKDVEAMGFFQWSLYPIRDGQIVKQSIVHQGPASSTEYQRWVNDLPKAPGTLVASLDLQHYDAEGTPRLPLMRILITTAPHFTIRCAVAWPVDRTQPIDVFYRHVDYRLRRSTYDMSSTEAKRTVFTAATHGSVHCGPLHVSISIDETRGGSSKILEVDINVVPSPSILRYLQRPELCFEEADITKHELLWPKQEFHDSTSERWIEETRAHMRPNVSSY